MKELISIGLGPLSNCTMAHFWNFQDEWLKYESSQGREGKATTFGSTAPVLYYETPKTGQYFPRALFIVICLLSNPHVFLGFRVTIRELSRHLLSGAGAN